MPQTQLRMEVRGPRVIIGRSQIITFGEMGNWVCFTLSRDIKVAGICQAKEEKVDINQINESINQLVHK